MHMDMQTDLPLIEMLKKDILLVLNLYIISIVEFFHSKQIKTMLVYGIRDVS